MQDQGCPCHVCRINRYLRVEAYYQQAARTAGTTVQSSLDATLKNSTVCNAIAGNSTAYGIMKSKYSSDMNSYIDSNWNAGLNLLNYKCKLKTYVFWYSKANGGVGATKFTEIQDDVGDAYLTTNSDGSVTFKAPTTDSNHYAVSTPGFTTTGYSTLYVEAACDWAQGIHIFQNNSKRTTIKEQFGKQWISVSLSSYQGSGYQIGIGGYYIGSGTVYRAYMV